MLVQKQASEVKQKLDEQIHSEQNEDAQKAVHELKLVLDSIERQQNGLDKEIKQAFELLDAIKD